MKNRTSYILTAFVILTALAACVSETQQPSSPTPVPSTPTPIPPTPISPPIAITTLEDLLGEDMAGEWFRLIVGSKPRLEFHEDGRIYWTERAVAPLPQDIWFEDGLLHVREDSFWCSDDQIGIYEVHGVPGDYIVLTIVEEPCFQRRFQGKWKEVSDN